MSELTYNQRYYLKNKAKIKAQVADYRRAHRADVALGKKKHYENSRERHRLACREFNKRLKVSVFEYYSEGSCGCGRCGNTDINVLTIDHVNNDGAAHRKEFGVSGHDLYGWLKKHNYPLGFQVLCFNCQFKKQMDLLRASRITPRQLRQAARKLAIKAECLQHFGAVCICGESCIDVLTLDHIDNDGREHRERIGNNIYEHLNTNGFVTDVRLQTLCINCNMLRRCQSS